MKSLREPLVGLQYSILARRSYFTSVKRYMNMGYWEAKPEDLDEACDAMARFVGKMGKFSSGDRILDLGFGFADQDVLWAEEFAPRKIVGLDISPFHVSAARRRVKELGLSDRIELMIGSATKIRFPRGIFDKVVSLESAFHFATREDFFREAFRVLGPRGCLVLTDIIPETEGTSALSRISHSANLYPRSVYVQKLLEVGFEAVEIRSIREHVCLHYCRHVARCLADPRRRMGSLARRMFSATADPASYKNLDYVLVTAAKEPR